MGYLSFVVSISCPGNIDRIVREGTGPARVGGDLDLISQKYQSPDHNCKKSNDRNNALRRGQGHISENRRTPRILLA